MKSETPTHTSSRDPWSVRRLATFLLSVLVLNEIAVTFGFWHWNIGFGVYFTAFWMLPRRYWWLLVALCASTNLFRGAFLIEGMYFDKDHVLGYWNSFIQLAMGNLVPPFVIMAGVQLLVDWKVPVNAPNTPEKFRALILATSVAAFFQALKDLIYVVDDGQIGDVRLGRIVDLVPLDGSRANDLLVQFGFMHFAGAFLGVMLVAPIALWALSSKARSGNRRMVRRVVPSLLALIVLYLSVSLLPGFPALSATLRMLFLVSAIVLALRFGWRGALLSLLAISIAVAWQDHLHLADVKPWLLQAFLAITGATGLLFGALMDANRAQARDARAQTRLRTRLHDSIALAAVGNLQRETAERHRIAGALHDEFGQNLTAFQTHLRLLRPDFERANRLETLARLNAISDAMRHSVRNVLESLRPSTLDELGIFGAIDQGALRQRVEAQGMHYDVELQGDARLLPALHDAVRVAAYRLVQECVMNSIRHAQASRCTVRMRVEQRNGRIMLFLDIRDDGVGKIIDLHRMGGLSTIHDHVTALGGRLHFQTLDPGIRVHALLVHGTAA